MEDFVVRFATVNGTGSASANGILARALFRCGLSIGPKNMFPSNIQGMPTWYEIRVNNSGFSSRKEQADLLVSVNRNSIAEDLKGVRSGAFVLYDSTGGFLPPKREDLQYLALPMTQLALEAFPTSAKRFNLQNIIYVGAVSALLKIPVQKVEELIQERYGKKKGVESDLTAFQLGFRYAQEHFPCPLPFAIEAKEADAEKILIEGNYALALGCLYAGATVVGWYPITPSTGLVEHFSALCEKHRKDPDSGTRRFALIQAEDEMTAIGIVVGAAWNGTRSFTATSGPGFSLMNEILGFAYYAEIPTVLFNVQRCGPSTGLPTRNQQADLLQAAYASHGDTKHILLFPSHPEECFHFAYLAFDLADRFQTPVIVMTELETAMNEFVSNPLKWDSERQPDRGKLLRKEEFQQRQKPFFRYTDEDGDGIPYRSLPGDDAKLAYFTRGSGHDRFGRYTEDASAYAENMERIAKKFRLLSEKLPAPEWIQCAKPSYNMCVVYFGSTNEAMGEVLAILNDKGIFVDTLRIRSFPFSKETQSILNKYKNIVVVEQNRDAQMKKLLCGELQLGVNVQSVCFFDGMPLIAEKLAAQIASQI